MCPSHQIGRVLPCPIAEEEKLLILGGNMQRLLATRR
jgi:hypothetical protein